MLQAKQNKKALGDHVNVAPKNVFHNLPNYSQLYRYC